ncbi:MAG: hypothetical protein P8M11_10450 [Planctomycetota bacterium]|nr:hypothetical protein [Planctomycetota bacterium]MDG1984979.1 hypothetical protein [Planctomycetota bacterium]
MKTSKEQTFFGEIDPSSVLNVVSEEFANTIGLVMPFTLEEPLFTDSVHLGVPGADEGIRVAFKLGFRTPAGARSGFIQVPLESALVFSGGLQTLPADEVRAMSSRKAPNKQDKVAIHEGGKIVGSAVESRLQFEFNADFEVIFAGCQGMVPGALPSLPGYGGESFIVRRQQARFPRYDPFELLIAVPI